MQTYLINPYEMKEKIKVGVYLAGIVIALCAAVASLVAILWIADSLGIPM